MKNIHVLPTDKPSRLYFDVVTKELLLQDKTSTNPTSFPIEKRNIYITSDEEIKEGDWMLDTIQTCLQPIELATKESIFLLNTPEQGWKKIILTDNTDLIKDGVQAIDDEFLECFVKNPSCEFVEVKKEKIVLGEVSGTTYTDFKYKLIIPKEQQKQHLIDMMRSDEELGLYDEPKQEIVIPANTLKAGDTISFEAKANFKVEPKQETLEEFIEKELEGYDEVDVRTYKTFIYLGAKWHEENVLSHHINVLAERIADKAKTVCGYGDCDMPYCDMQCQVVDSNSIREIAKDYINELNLQSSK